jgi:hypothetical protein
MLGEMPLLAKPENELGCEPNMQFSPSWEL